VDGKQWTDADYKKLIKKGINPLTINRIFPIVNLINGYFIRHQQDIIAKGRTRADSELSQVMSESIAFVRDQNKGAELVKTAFNDEIVAGFGCIQVGKNPDPRREVVQWKQRPWYSCWWDPYASPWLDKDDCRYFFTAGWKNLEDVVLTFPEKRKEIEDKFSQLGSSYYMPDVYDQGSQIEDYHRYLSSNHWVNSERKRIRPIEMWYTHIQKGWFAKMPDSRVIDLDTLPNPNEQMQVVYSATELITAYVKKMRVATFVSDLKLQDIPTPYPHDLYPFAPFVGYLDRFNCPYGIPRQIKEQSMEVNKRRSMALSLISNRRVIIEEDAAKDITKVYDEANRSDGLIVLKKGRKGGFEIQEMAALAQPQIELLHQSEREIQEIVGANDEALGKESKLQSGVALDKKHEMSATVTASLLENAKHSHMRLGELTTAMIQGEWNGPKVLRVTDRMSGAEKFIEINQKLYDPASGAITVRNNIAESTFDIVISPAPMTDTMREKNMDLLFGAINKAPPEAIGPLLNLALEISDLPDKDALVKQIRAVTGMDPLDENLTIAQKDEMALRLKAAKEQAQAEEADLTRREREAKIAETTMIAEAKARKYNAEAEAATENVKLNSWLAGAKTGLELLKNESTKVPETA